MIDPSVKVCAQHDCNNEAVFWYALRDIPRQFVCSDCVWEVPDICTALGTPIRIFRITTSDEAETNSNE